jgi:hypothetical protein
MEGPLLQQRDRHSSRPAHLKASGNVVGGQRTEDRGVRKEQVRAFRQVSDIAVRGQEAGAGRPCRLLRPLASVLREENVNSVKAPPHLPENSKIPSSF